MIWLGERRGSLSDWTTQKWVQATGRSVDLERDPWLAGPVGGTRAIGRDFFQELARHEGLSIAVEPDAGLLPRFDDLAGEGFDSRAIHPDVVDFYERTAAFELDAWGEWCGVFRPFGRLVAALFSRRLQQLNVPLSALDTSHGVTSEVLRLVDGQGQLRRTAWLRRLVRSDAVLYAGEYSICRVPRHPGPCVKVVFPLPNGNAVVVMRPTVEPGGALLLSSHGRGFGDAGFYFTVHDATRGVHAKYLRTFRETIRVFADSEPVPEHQRSGGGGDVRADHVFELWGATFLRLHYRLARRSTSAAD